MKKAGAAFARQPVGTGPFKLSSWQKDKRLVLTANQEYWRGRPSIDEYIDTIEPRAEVLNKYFKDGMLDIIYSYSISKMISYKKQDWVQIIATPLPLGHLCRDQRRPAAAESRKAVRQALCHAWDPRALKLVFQDYVLPIHSLLPGGLMAANRGEQPLGFSLAKAQALLKKEGAGARDPAGDALAERRRAALPAVLHVRQEPEADRRQAETDAPGPDGLRPPHRPAATTTWPTRAGSPIIPTPTACCSPCCRSSCKNRASPTSPAASAPTCTALDAARREGDAKNARPSTGASTAPSIADGLVIPLYQDKRVIIFNRKLGNIQPDPLGKLFLFDLQMK